MEKLENVEKAIGAVEAEMRRAGLWSDQPLEPERYEFTQAFGMDTMAFSQWVQFILVPRVRSIIESGGGFPATSQVGAQAVREFDGVEQADGLVSALQEFDRVVEE
ncbi:MAG: tRNA pseudouridine synthase [Chlorobi bacterium]|nr:tRNA pseudouridine synthase [Chlorobiota bacterium]